MIEVQTITHIYWIVVAGIVFGILLWMNDPK